MDLKGIVCKSIISIEVPWIISNWQRVFRSAKQLSAGQEVNDVSMAVLANVKLDINISRHTQVSTEL
jgi:hypothetical protein